MFNYKASCLIYKCSRKSSMPYSLSALLPFVLIVRRKIWAVAIIEQNRYY